MILTQTEIRKQLKKKRVVIAPFDATAIGPASIDLRLGDRLRVFRKGEPIVIEEGVDYQQVTRAITLTKKGYLLRPGEFVIGITKERITLPSDICGWLNSRSRFARVGLMSHITAPFVCPGVSNHQVLEIYNVGSRSVRLLPDVKVCQLILQQCKGSATYAGQFKDQRL